MKPREAWTAAQARAVHQGVLDYGNQWGKIVADGRFRPALLGRGRTDSERQWNVRLKKRSMDLPKKGGRTTGENHRWTAEEEQAVMNGVAAHGVGKPPTPLGPTHIHLPMIFYFSK